jgi:hypothetical protein
MTDEVEMAPEDGLVSRRGGRASPYLVAMARSDANEPWPGPSSRARQVTESLSTAEIVDQGRANGQSNREIADTLEMNGFGDAEEWENALYEEEMRNTGRLEQIYPPNDSVPPLSTDMPPNEGPFYGETVDIGFPELTPDDVPPSNYDDYGNPMAEAQPGYDEPVYEETVAYEEPVYEEPYYEEETVAYDEPVYEEQYVEEYA